MANKHEPPGVMYEGGYTEVTVCEKCNAVVSYWDTGIVCHYCGKKGAKSPTYSARWLEQSKWFWESRKGHWEFGDDIRPKGEPITSEGEKLSLIELMEKIEGVASSLSRGAALDNTSRLLKDVGNAADNWEPKK